MRHALLLFAAAANCVAAPSLSQLPLSFEPNRGQAGKDAEFVARAPGFSLALSKNGAVLNLGSPVSVRWSGANPSPRIEGIDPQPGFTNYLLGNDPARWRTQIPSYARVRYHSIYPGIDLIYYGNQKHIEFDLIVAPGADPARIEMAIEGADARLDASGDLVLDTPSGEIRQLKPRIYQDQGATRKEITGGYQLNGRRVRFEIAGYDRALPLIIDPVYVTYAGGSLRDADTSIAVDSSGNVYVAGDTGSTNFPAAGTPYQASFQGGAFDCVVFKLSPTGASFVYRTYLGGTGNDRCRGIAVDGSGNAYVAGFTTSSNFPTASPFQGTISGTAEDAFVTKLNATGSGLVYSSYAGGTGTDQATGIAVDSTGLAFVTGNTGSTNFPIFGTPFQATNRGGTDGFVLRIGATGVPTFSSYIGGNGADTYLKVALSANGNAYLAGSTTSTNLLTTPGVVQPTGGSTSDVFVAAINPSAAALIYLTYFGGPDDETLYAIAVDPFGGVAIGGQTDGAMFPVDMFPLDGTFGGASEGFITVLDTTASRVALSTFYGGSGDDGVTGLAFVDGYIYATLFTTSTDIVTFGPFGAFQPAAGGGGDGFFAVFSPFSIEYATYLGGSAGDGADAIALDPAGNVYLSGFTASTNFPWTAGAAQTTYGGGLFDMFVASIDSAILRIVTPSLLPAGTQGVAYSTTLNAAGGSGMYFWSCDCSLPPGLTLSSAGVISGTPTTTGTFPFNITVGDTFENFANRDFSLTIVAAGAGPVISTTSPLPAGTAGSLYSQTIAATGGTPPYTFTVETGSTLPPGLTLAASGALTGTPTTAGPYTFTLRVTDAVASSSTRTFSLTILPAGPALAFSTTSPLPNGTSGSPYSQTVAATGGAPPYTFTVESGSSLPAGLTLSASGALTGTPTTAGPYTFTLRVTDAVAASSTRTFSLTILPALAFSTTSPLPSGTTGSPYSQAVTATGGTAPYTFTVEPGSTLPPGLTLGASGALTGTPTTAGPYTFTLRVTDSVAASSTRTFSLTIAALPTITTTSPLPAALAGTSYTVTLSATGGTPPYTFALLPSGGATPSGLTLSAAGQLSGVPGAVGTSTFTIEVTDSTGLKGSRSFILTVNSSQVLITTRSPLPEAFAGAPYSMGFSADGGVPPYRWTLGGGSTLPAGLTLDSSGQLSGTPTRAGGTRFEVVVTDTVGTSASFFPTIVVLPALTITAAPLPPGSANNSYAFKIPVSGGAPPYRFSISAGSLPPGLTLDAATGQLSGTPRLTAAASAKGRAAATVYNFTVLVTDLFLNRASLAMSLSIYPTVQEVPRLLISQTALSFTATAGGDAPTPQYLAATASDLSSIGFTASSDAAWLRASPASANTPANLVVRIDQTSLAVGPRRATLTIAGPYNTEKITVDLTVENQPPRIEVTPTLMRFGARRNTPGVLEQTIFVRNAGGGTLRPTASVTSGAEWLSIVDSGSQVRVRANTQGLTIGPYRGVVRIDSNGGSVDVPVSLFVSEVGGVIQLSPLGIQFEARQGNGTSLPQDLLIANTGDQALNWTADVVRGGEWLTLGARTGATTPGAVSAVTLTANAGSRTAGAYHALIRVSSNDAVNSPQYFVVVLSVLSASTPPRPTVTPAGLVFVGVAGGAQPSPQTVRVYASNTAPIPFQAAAIGSDGAKWLTVAPLTGSTSTAAPGRVDVSASTSGLARGIYTGDVTVSLSSQEIRTVNVTLIVLPAGATLPAASSKERAAAGCTATRMAPTFTGLVNNFSSALRWPTPIAVRLLDDCGEAVSNGQVVAAFSNGDPVLPLAAAPSRPGVYTGTWTPGRALPQITVTANALAPSLPRATTQITGSTTPNNGAALSLAGITNNLNPLAGDGLAPGSVVQVSGTGLADSVFEPGVVPLPLTVNGTTVIVGGTESPLFYLSGGQLNAQIPVELVPDRQYAVLVSTPVGFTVPETVNIGLARPGLLNLIQRTDSSAVTAENPARPGDEVVLYLIGMGATDPVVPSGTASPSDPPARVRIEPSVKIGDLTATVRFAGLAPGLVGLYQVNLVVPPESRIGDLPVAVSQAGVSSNTITLPVR